MSQAWRRRGWLSGVAAGVDLLSGLALLPFPGMLSGALQRYGVAPLGRIHFSPRGFGMPGQEQQCLDVILTVLPEVPLE